MPLTQLGDKRLGKHAIKLGGIEGTSVLSSSFEGMLSRVKIPGLSRDI